jgi:hypothetical protein
VGPRAPASRRWSTCCRGSSIPSGRSITIDGVDVRDLPLQEPALADRPGDAGDRALQRHRRNNIAYWPQRGVARARARAAAASYADEFIMAMPQGYDTVIGESGAGSRAASASASPSRARCSRTPPSWCSTRPPRSSTPSRRRRCRRRWST